MNVSLLTKPETLKPADAPEAIRGCFLGSVAI